VYGITGAPTRHSDDLEKRMVRYLVSMAIRTACVVLVLVVHHPVRWVFAAGAVVLPYVAVILANAAGPRRGVRTASAADLHALAAGSGGPAPTPGEAPGDAGTTSGDAGPASGRVVLTGIVLPPEPAPGRAADAVDHAVHAPGGAPGG